MKCAVEIGIHRRTKFHKDWFRHSKVDGGDTETRRQHDDGISLLSLFSKLGKWTKMEKKYYMDEEDKEEEEQKGNIRRKG
jgi:hypothetical protein